MRQERLIKCRRESRMNQEDVARAIGVTRSTYVRYETGKRRAPVSKALLIARILHSSVEFLFGSEVPNGNTDGEPRTGEGAVSGQRCPSGMPTESRGDDVAWAAEGTSPSTSTTTRGVENGGF